MNGIGIGIGRKRKNWSRYWNKPKLVLTFDECTESQYNVAYPLAINKGVTFTTYLIGDNIGDSGKLTWNNCVEMYNAGIDIQCHSKSHSDFTTLTDTQILTDLTSNSALFVTNGLPSPIHFSYPFGGYNENVKSTVSILRKTGRGTDSEYYPITGESDKMSLNAISIDNLSDAGLITVKGYMDKAKSENGAIILYGHGMSTAGSQYEIPTQKASDIFDYALLNGFEVISMSQLYRMMKKSTTEQEMVDLTISSSGNGAGVSTLKIYAKEDTVLTLDGTARFYSDAAGTLDESTTFWLQRGTALAGGGRMVYIKCSSGTSTLSLAKDFIVKISSWATPTNAPIIGGDISLVTGLDYINVAGNNTFYGDISLLQKLTYIYVAGGNTISGSIAGLTLLTSLTLTGNNTISGNISLLTKLTNLYVTGYNTLTGSVTNLTLLTVFQVTGSNTLSGSVAGLTQLTILYVTGSNTLTGSISSLISLTNLTVLGSNTLSGSIEFLTSLETLYVSGNNTIEGSIDYLTSLTYLSVSGSNTLSGNPHNWVNNLTFCYLSPCGITDYTAETTWPNINITINPSVGYGFSSTEMNNILADMAASTSLASKTITIKGSSSARTIASNSSLITIIGRGNNIDVSDPLMDNLLLTSTGTGAGVVTLKMTVSSNITVALDGTARFYSDAAGTLDESSSWNLNSGGDRTIYLKCPSGTANMILSDPTKLTKWGAVGVDGWVSGTNAPSVTGDISKFTNITVLRVQGNNVLFGDVTTLTSLNYLFVYGSNIISGSVTNLISLTRLEVAGNNRLTGNISNLPSLTIIQVTGNNRLSGDVTALTLLTTLYVSGFNTISGNISNLKSLTYLSISGSNTVSGDLGGSGTSAVVNGITTLYLVPCAMTQYTPGATWSNATITINPSVGYGYSSNIIDSILIDMAASPTLISKTITLKGSNGVRTSASDAAVATLTGVGRTCTLSLNT